MRGALDLGKTLVWLRPRARAAASRHGLRLALTLALAWLSVRSVLRATGGEPAVPLDDAFIHFQYARSFWEGHGFAYTAGASPAPGATSLLWPALLALPYGLGLRAEQIIWAAWLFGWGSLGMLGYETRRAGERLLSADGALAAELMVLSFGGYVWYATSGMEVVPLAWVLLRTARRAAEYAEPPGAERPRPWELVTLAWLAPLVRPEGALATLSAAAVLLGAGRGRRRAFGLLALIGVALPPLVNLAFTGQSATTTARVKWLPLNPYVHTADLASTVLANVKLLFGTLLNGEVWSAVFLPQGSGLLLWLALPALVLAGFRQHARRRAALLTLLGLGILLPTTYDSFLWNRLRYLWPFLPAWFLGVAALTDGLGAVAARFGPGLERLRLLFSGLVLGGLVSRLGWTLEDLGSSANAIRSQQVSLGRWAAKALPRDATIGVNDTGAIAYFSGRRVFDVVGLTTAGEAPYWVAGAGSRFEHYEHLGRSRLPTHFIVYTNWFGLPSLLGAFQTERSVPGATILGGETMVAHVASYTVLGSGASPHEGESRACPAVDEVDVADLESESLHGYELFAASSATNVALESDGRVDGGRSGRTLERFFVSLVPGGRFVSRVETDDASALELAVTERVLGRRPLESGGWQELTWEIPSDLPLGRARVELRVLGGTVTALHHWSLGACPTR